jgi:hypothetical protein
MGANQKTFARFETYRFTLPGRRAGFRKIQVYSKDLPTALHNSEPAVG